MRVFQEPGALTAALNWYRAAGTVENILELEELDSNISTPTLFIWGKQDHAIARNATESMSLFMKGPYDRIEIDAGHRLISEKPSLVLPKIIDHILDNQPLSTPIL